MSVSNSGFEAIATGKAILLVGGAGYVGSHAAKYLASMGYVPVVFDNLSLGHRESVKWGPLEVGDIHDQDALGRAFLRHAPVAVMHFAAFAYVGESVADPAKYYHNNVSGTLSLLEAMRKARVGKLIFSSTCATYGLPAVIPITENMLQCPINPYGRTKLMVEQLLTDYRAAYGLESACLRYFNAAGADPDGEIGEDHEPETHLIPIVLEVAAGRRPCVTVFGNDYPTRDGTCVRDYVHVTDLAQAHYLALRRLLEGRGDLKVNLGNGSGYSVKEVVEAAERVTGRSIKVEYSSRREGDPPELVGSQALARRELGWDPRYGALEEIVGTAWRWHSKKWESGWPRDRTATNG
jgi:UDP-glucose-4-epimerase GalE